MVETSDGKYELYRKAAKGLHTMYVTEDHPCGCGGGRCCMEPNIPVCEGDKEVILSAIQRGKISRTDILHAKRRVVEDATACGFLRPDTNKCTIYQYRPMICVATGGLFMYKGDPKTSSLKYVHYDDFINIPLSEASSTMCGTCEATFKNLYPDEIIPKEVMIVSARILEHTATRVTGINSFICEIEP